MPITALRSGKTFEPNIDPPENRENQKISSLAQESLETLREQEKRKVEPSRVETFEEGPEMYCCDFFVS